VGFLLEKGSGSDSLPIKSLSQKKDKRDLKQKRSVFNNGSLYQAIHRRG
jgi:hypothetical protein